MKRNIFLETLICVLFSASAFAQGLAINAPHVSFESGTNGKVSLNAKGTGTIQFLTNDSLIGGFGTLGDSWVSTGTLAAAGSTVADAGAIANQITYVTASDGAKGVKLPAPTIGATYVVINTVASSLLVYPPTSGTINGGSANAAITLLGLQTARFVKVTATAWYAATDEDPARVNMYMPYTSESVAAAGANQGNSAALSASKFVHTITAADNTTGVVLPAAGAGDVGKVHLIINTVQAKLLNIWPATGATINGGAANAVFAAGIATAGHGQDICIVTAANTWLCG